MKRIAILDNFKQRKELDLIKSKFLEEIARIPLNIDKDLLDETKVNVNKSLIILKQDEYFYKFLISIIQNQAKSNLDIKILLFYLFGLDSMHKMFKESDSDIMQLIIQIASELKYEHIRAKKIMFIKGEIGNNFYLIIKGKMNVLIPTERSVYLTEKEYLIYLTKLRKYGEFSLLKKCLKYNKNEFPITDLDLESWLSGKTPTICNLKELPFSKKIIGEIQSAIEYLTEEHHDDNIEMDKYINRIIFNNSKDEIVRKKVIIFKYVYVTTLKDDQTFGELALIKEKNKRTATIISEEDSDLAVIDKQTFKKCLYTINEKLKKQQIKYFLNYHFFKDLTFKKFSKKYFNFFRYKSIKRFDNLAIEGKESKNYIFLKTGEYQVTLKKKSLINLNDLLKNLGKEFTMKEELREKACIYEDPLYDKYMNEVRSFKITILNPFEIVGFDDTVKNGKYLFSIHATSTINEYYKIDKNSFVSFIDNSNIFPEKFESFIKARKEIFLKRLLEIKKSFTDFYFTSQKVKAPCKYFPKHFYGATKEETREIIKRETKSVQKMFRTLPSVPKSKSKSREYNNIRLFKNVKMEKNNNDENNINSRNRNTLSPYSRNNELIIFSNCFKQLNIYEKVDNNRPLKIDRNISEIKTSYNNMPNNIVSEMNRLNNFVRDNLPELSQNELKSFSTKTIDIINQEKLRKKEINEKVRKAKNCVSFSKLFNQTTSEFILESSLKKSEIKDKNTVFKIYSTIKNK